MSSDSPRKEKGSPKGSSLDERTAHIALNLNAIRKNSSKISSLPYKGEGSLSKRDLIDVLGKVVEYQRYILSLIVTCGESDFTLPPETDVNELLDVLDDVSDLESLIKERIARALKLPTFDPVAVAGRKRTPEGKKGSSEPQLVWEEGAAKYQETPLPPSFNPATPPLRQDLQEFSPSQIKEMRDHPVRMLGRGCFGKVIESKYNGLPVAVKLLNTTRESELISEIRALKASPGHPHLLQYIGCCTRRTRETGGKLVLITEVLRTKKGHTNLDQLIHDPDVHLTPYQRMRFAKHAALGVVWLHNAYHPPILHRDLATKNLFVTQDGQGKYIVKVGDFGLATKISRHGFNLDRDPKARPPGTALTMAPEVMHHHQFNTAADVYSFGMILWELWTRNQLETDSLYSLLDMKKFTSDFDAFVDLVGRGFRPALPHNIPKRLKKLISKCWDFSPARRPSMTEVLGEIENLLVEVAIPDPYGQRFWKTWFIGEEQVPWDSFVDAFYSFLRATLPAEENTGLTDRYVFAASGSFYSPSDEEKKHRRLSSGADVVIDGGGGSTTWPDAEFNHSHHNNTTTTSTDDGADRAQLSLSCLKALVAHKSGDEFFVDIETFGSCLAWYGPIKQSGRASREFLKRIRLLLQYPWFHGQLSGGGGTVVLKGQPRGTFLVRHSHDQGSFTLVLCTDPETRPLHLRITRDASGLYGINESVRFPTVQQVIRWLLQSGDKISVGSGVTLALLHPCPGSKFATIFSGVPLEQEDGVVASPETSDSEDEEDITNDNVATTMRGSVKATKQHRKERSTPRGKQRERRKGKKNASPRKEE